MHFWTEPGQRDESLRKQADAEERKVIMLMNEADDLRDEVQRLEGLAAVHEAKKETLLADADRADIADNLIDAQAWDLVAIRADPRQGVLPPC